MAQRISGSGAAFGIALMVSAIYGLLLLLEVL